MQLNFVARKEWFDGTLAQQNLSLLFSRICADYTAEQPKYNVLWKSWQAHQLVNGLPVEPNTDLFVALSLVNSTVKQENIVSARVADIISGKQGLLTLGVLVMPLWTTVYSHGGKDSQNRHRLCAIGAIAKLLKGRLAKAVEAGKLPDTDANGKNPDQHIDSQLLAVMELKFDTTSNYKDSFVLEKKTAVKKNVVSSRQRELDGLVTISFNGSRTPQKGEVQAVKLSQLGIDPTELSSILSGIANPDIPLTSKEGFILASLVKSYGDEGHSLRITPAMGVTSGTEYERLSPAGLSSAFGTMYDTCARFCGEGKEGNNVLKTFVTGCEDIVPKEGKKGWKTPAFNPAKHSFNPNLLEEVIEALLFDERPISEWQELTGLTFKLPQEVEVSLLELAFQILWVDQRFSGAPGNIGRSTGTSRVKGEVKLGNILAELLASLDDTDNLLAILPELDEEDEDEEYEEEGEEEEGEEDIDSFQFDD